MNFPGVISGDDHVLEKVQAAHGRPKDGHAPRVRGKALNAYLSPLSSAPTTSPRSTRRALRSFAGA